MTAEDRIRLALKLLNASIADELSEGEAISDYGQGWRKGRVSGLKASLYFLGDETEVAEREKKQNLTMSALDSSRRSSGVSEL